MEPFLVLFLVLAVGLGFLIYKSGHSAGVVSTLKQYVIQGAQVEAPALKTDLINLEARIKTEFNKLTSKAAPAPIDATVSTAQSPPQKVG